MNRSEGRSQIETLPALYNPNPSPEKEEAPADQGQGFEGVQTIGRELHRDDVVLTRERAWVLLMHACDVLSCAASVILSDGSLSNAGREVVTFTAIRLRQIREVME